MVDRFKEHYDHTPSTMRKAIGFNTAMYMHQATACFLHYMREFARIAPPEAVTEAEEELYPMLRQGFLDTDLHHSLSTRVPPGDLADISALRLGSVLLVCKLSFCQSVTHD